MYVAASHWSREILQVERSENDEATEQESRFIALRGLPSVRIAASSYCSYRMHFSNLSLLAVSLYHSTRLHTAQLTRTAPPQLVLALPSLVLGQNTTAAPSSGVSSSASATASTSGNATASATGNSTSIASNSTTAPISSATSANSTPLTTAATPAELTNTIYTAVTPGASGTVASGPGDE